PPLTPRPTCLPYTTLFRSLSSLRRTPVSSDGPSAMAATSSARLVKLLEPGTRMWLSTGPGGGDTTATGPGGFHAQGDLPMPPMLDRKSTRLNSSHVKISYA